MCQRFEPLHDALGELRVLSPPEGERDAIGAILCFERIGAYLLPAGLPPVTKLMDENPAVGTSLEHRDRARTTANLSRHLRKVLAFAVREARPRRDHDLVLFRDVVAERGGVAQCDCRDGTLTVSLGKCLPGKKIAQAGEMLAGLRVALRGRGGRWRGTRCGGGHGYEAAQHPAAQVAP